MSQNNTAMKQEVLKSYIEQVFNSYDTQRTGSLTSNEITAFFNDLFRSVDVNIILNTQQAEQAVKAVYPHYTNRISKDELYQVFKTLLGISSVPQPQQPSNIGQYGGYNPTMVNSAAYMNPQNFYQNMSLQYLGQNYMMAQNYLRQGQGLPNGYQVNGNAYSQGNQNNGNGQFRK